MQRVQCLGYIRFVHGQRGFQQLVRLFDELYQFGAVAGLDHLQQFGAHFLVGDAQRLMVEVVGKVAVVREQGKQFIATFQCVPVVAVVEHRHLFLVAYQQVFDGLFHSVEVHDVYVEGRVFVQVGFKSRVRVLVGGIGWIGHPKVFKQFAAVARLVVIGIQHPGGHGLAEATGTAHTGEPVFRVDGSVDERDKC